MGAFDSCIYRYFTLVIRRTEYGRLFEMGLLGVCYERVGVPVPETGAETSRNHEVCKIEMDVQGWSV